MHIHKYSPYRVLMGWCQDRREQGTGRLRKESSGLPFVGKEDRGVATLSFERRGAFRGPTRQGVGVAHVFQQTETCSKALSPETEWQSPVTMNDP